ncbi:DUF4329 domain-containing protein [Octadecabacter sp. 1_MG-2023]|uniref:DUF4329 domain-containing protein n=1 Tax=unclassified Octadecabacter TaxID=196158 RepID=UPI001C09BA3A|nr:MULTISPECIES: DUF4329 domain-containing protein [unclassified Octadecabacter]MBU2993470.1 DUF4329 domain-containing protein [Octadecabacter sp. B2R22]MDO6733074.1 DUF4329 domain-containing protein [Octadecabacter sp. 1_MG-2023]
MIRIAALLTTAVLAMTACAPQVGLNSQQVTPSGLQPGNAGFSVVAAGSPTGFAVDQFAIGVLNGLQTVSIAEKREYCGYIWQDQFGQLQATVPVAGTRTGCEMNEPQIGTGILASYHTHGAYSPRLRGEIPSGIDLQGDFNYGINGYVSTPGGRVWLNDYATRSTRQLCGRACVFSDTGYDDRYDADIQQSYSQSQVY